ncbi:MAG TPA: GreA/GreB family elongation factor [Thermoanaerobaculales bacterium]|nr:GreA/GreB family elongation factor [Thermoanaerobaculales bacterium]HPA81219.1 GreA/GreB family elongation factor [Thermoanaerobaculales bacterium]HQL28910.1 GreA/GreB family elongation factor [Thermoanaerobaculales bacterium]HQN96402.1 GreA/GreB family elongation factor [Thermoanaerobaculales bacterium]
MADRPELHEGFPSALEAGDLDRVEELWLEALDSPAIAVDDLLEVRRALWKNGHKALAATLLELLADTLEQRREWEAALTVLREIVRLTEKPGPELVARLERALTGARAGSPSLKLVLERHPLQGSRRPLDQLEIIERWLAFDRGTTVEVVGQGVGRVVDANLSLENIKVDLGGARRAVSVPFGAAPRFLRRLPPGDFRRRAVEDPERLRLEALEAPGEALVGLLESLAEPADVAAIKAALEGIVDADGWTGWWAKARKHPRLLASGAGSRLRYTVGASAAAAADLLLEELRSAEPRQRLAVARRLAARGAAEAEATAAFLTGTLADLADRDPGLAWETAGALSGIGRGTGEEAAFREGLLAGCPPLRLLLGIQDRGEREAALAAARAADPDHWAELWSDWMLHEQHPAVLDLIARSLDGEGAVDLLDAAVEAVFRNHLEHPAQFVWACEAMVQPGAPEPLRRRATPSLLEKLPDTLTRPEFGPLRGRAKALLDGGGAAVRVILEAASPQQADRLVSRVARISAVEPQRVRVLEQAAAQRRGAPAAESDTPLLVASEEAIEARRLQLKELLEVEIPKTLKGITAAAAEGDLRENFEYHMLRDRQELQSAKAAKLQRELAMVRALKPGSADTSRVNIGTVVQLAGADGAPLPPVTILGPWDADVGRRIFANGSELAQRLLGAHVGDRVEMDGGPATITRIDAWPAGR